MFDAVNGSIGKPQVKWEGLEKIRTYWHDGDMHNTTREPMEPSNQFCPHTMCSARGRIGGGNVTIHDRKRQRYRCKVCKQTFSARRGTMFEGLRKPMGLITSVVTLLSYGCPVQAIVHADRDWTNGRWRSGGIGLANTANGYMRR